mmetsp:Transcript_59152/g.139354  ORF Transcript_59152/g.139354 Transcript_59152/m.139354 type:complete len:287 (-) Transcript_59152:1824-2684(-)
MDTCSAVVSPLSDRYSSAMKSCHPCGTNTPGARSDDEQINFVLVHEPSLTGSRLNRKNWAAALSRSRLPRDGGAPTSAPLSHERCSTLAKRGRIHAVAKTARLRPIREDVPQMSVAHVARRLNTRHSMAAVSVVRNKPRCKRLGEAGPAALALELGGRVEEIGLTPATCVDARFEEFAHRRAMCALGSCLAHDTVLLRGQTSMPLSITQLDSAWRLRIAIASQLKNTAPSEDAWVRRLDRRRCLRPLQRGDHSVGIELELAVDHYSLRIDDDEPRSSAVLIALHQD